jgi:hypothetical protein
MKQLTTSKKRILLASLKRYRRRYLVGKYTELDESATRLMINDFLTEVLGFASLDEVKTEYMIRGTYADYIVQMKGKRYFVVEVKSMGIDLSPKHLRQAVNYAANEGIDWALLTNARRFDFYKILFTKPIDSRKVFSLDLSDEGQLKIAADSLQYLTKHLLPKKGLECLWHKYSALEPSNVSRLLFAKTIISYLRRDLKRTFKTKFSEDEIKHVINRIIEEQIEDVKPRKSRRKKRSHVPKAGLATKQMDKIVDETSR